jgi:lipoprotein-releasing system permease protein
MNFTSFMAFRYLRAHREHSFISWITLLTISGTAIGVATMVVVLSVINGFEDELRNRFLAANAHVLAYRFPAGMSNYQEWEKLIEKDYKNDIIGMSPFIHAETMGRKEYLTHSVLVRGINPKMREKVQSLASVVRPLSAFDLLQDEIDEDAKTQSLKNPPGIIVGTGLLSLMNAKIGDVIELISPTAESQNPLGEVMGFKVVGVYDSGLQHYDSKLVILSIPAAQKLFNLKHLVTGLEIGLKHPSRSIEIAAKMNMTYDLSIKEWQSYNHNIFEAMRNERTVIAFIVALVAFVASFNILTTLYVSVAHKQRDISILKALGADNRQILAVFLKQSTLMGVLGGISGLLLALVISYLLSNYPFINLPDIYLLAKLPVEYDWRVYLGVCGSGIVVSALAGLYPAWTATRVPPTLGVTTRSVDS